MLICFSERVKFWEGTEYYIWTVLLCFTFVLKLYEVINERFLEYSLQFYSVLWDILFPGMWTQVRRLEHAVFLRDDKSMKEMLRKHSVQSPPGTLRLFCWGFVCICSLRSPPLKKNLTEKNSMLVFISGVPSGECMRIEQDPETPTECTPAPQIPQGLRL